MSERDFNSLPLNTGEPDFENLLAVLRREKPSRPTLFEFFLNGPLYERLIADDLDGVSDEERSMRWSVTAFTNAGYDYTTYHVPGFNFPHDEVARKDTKSLNEGAVITDRESFERYPWPDVSGLDLDILKRVKPHLPDGMKLIIPGPGGTLENVIQLTGYDNLCFMVVDDPDFASEIFEAVGSALVAFYTACLEYEAVGAVIGNDDWGFKSQTMLSPADMRKYVFPWHKKIVEAAHAAGKPAILHSCGNLSEVMDDVTDDMKYDGKHSFEDIIQPVEDAYDQYGNRIALMGGIDVDFVCRRSPQEVYDRTKAMIGKTGMCTGWGVGTGNSVPEYVPDEGYLAMVRACLDYRA
jgi:uroporphyrinogen decarboxylase